jgi:hypothetical protein
MYRRNIVLTFATAALLSFGAGCAMNQQQQKYIQQKMDGYVIDKPMSALWPDITSVLAEAGFEAEEIPTKPNENGVYTLETRLNASGAKLVQYAVTVSPQSSKSTIVTFNRVEPQGEQMSPKQDPDLLWKFVKRVDPANAKLIESEARASTSR